MPEFRKNCAADISNADGQQMVDFKKDKAILLNDGTNPQGLS